MTKMSRFIFFSFFFLTCKCIFQQSDYNKFENVSQLVRYTRLRENLKILERDKALGLHRNKGGCIFEFNPEERGLQSTLCPFTVLLILTWALLRHLLKKGCRIRGTLF